MNNFYFDALSIKLISFEYAGIRLYATFKANQLVDLSSTNYTAFDCKYFWAILESVEIPQFLLNPISYNIFLSEIIWNYISPRELVFLRTETIHSFNKLSSSTHNKLLLEL